MKPINMSKSRQQEFIILSACFWKVEHFLMNDVQFSLLWILHMYVYILMNDMFFISLHCYRYCTCMYCIYTDTV